MSRHHTTTNNNTQGALNSTDAAAYLGVSVRTLSRWRSVGYGPRFVKYARAVSYRVDDLDTFMASRSVPAEDSSSLDEHVSRLVALAPRLSASQTARLRAALGGGH